MNQAHIPMAGVYALLTDGTTIEIRATRPDDIDAVRLMHAAMSPDNVYLRFFNLSPHAAEQEAKRVCREPGEDHAALLAWLGSQLVGVASYEPTGTSGSAEIAFAVADHMHGRGVATLLLEHLVSIARRRNLSAFTAQTLATNTAMLRVFAAAGLPAKRQLEDGLVSLTFPLPRDDDSDRRMDSYLDVVAGRESRADVASLRYLLAPTSVAVVGASRRRGTVGHAILHNIVGDGYSGHIYAVNPRGGHAEGVTCVPSVSDLPEPVDLAVIVVPAQAVRDVAEECGKRGVRGLVVITADLDTGSGADLLAICRRHGMRLIGPNCFGVAAPHLGLNATFAVAHPAPGDAGLVVQSGAVGVALLDQLSRLGIGISSFASVGDKYDVSTNDLLLWWEQDDMTRLAVMYVESFGSPRKFARTARRVGKQIPVLAVYAGRSAVGHQAAASHAAAATPLVTREALFEQAGIISTTSLGELLEATALLASQPLPAGDRVAIVSNAGGGVVLAADACADAGLRVTALSGPTQRRLRYLLPSGAAVKGPVDTTAAVGARAFRSCLEEIAADDAVDMILAIAVPTAIADLVPAITRAKTTKPLAAALLSQPDGVSLLARDGPHPQRAGSGSDDGNTAGGGEEPGGSIPTKDAVPCYAYPETAARALGHATRYQAWRSSERGQVPELDGIREADARALTGRFLARHTHGGWLSAGETIELLGCYGIALIETRPVTTEEAAVRVAAELGGHVALKADVPGLVHESDAGGVQSDLHTKGDVRRAYHRLADTFGSGLDRVLVQPMISGGIEVLIGVAQDPVFGPLVVLSLGGASTDVLTDHAARLAPLTDTDAADMIRGVRAAPLLFGQRGAQRGSITPLAETLLRVSKLADDLPEVAELGPIIARTDGISAVGARVRISSAEPQDPFLRRLR